MFLKLIKICGRKNVKKNVPLSELTTIKIGGKAKYVVYPNSLDEIVDLVNLLKKLKVNYYVLGAGSNVLADDAGFNGVIIKLTNLCGIKQYNEYLQVDAGVMLGVLVSYCIKNGLGGFEDAIGIPGTVGGAVVMNAGAYNYETSKNVLGVLFLKDNKINYFDNTDCNFGYRKSAFTSSDIILSVDFKTTKNNSLELKNRANFILEKRKKLPKLPSLGSVFKRNDSVIVSVILDELGLKGKSVGDAMVSLEHAGVIVNKNNATSKDTKKLIEQIKTICKQEKNIDLVEEIKYL